MSVSVAAAEEGARGGAQQEEKEKVVPLVWAGGVGHDEFFSFGTTAGGSYTVVGY